MGILDRFFVALGFQVDTKGIDQFEAKTEEMRAGILRLGALFTGAAIGIGLMVDEATKGMTAISRFAELNQLAATEVAAWNRVAFLNHVSNEDAMSSLQTLNQRMGEAVVGLGRGKMIFERLGLSARDSAGHVKSLDQILGDVAAKMEKSGSRAANIAMARRLGIDPHLVPMLEKGREEWRKLREESLAESPLTDADYKRAEEFELAMKRARERLELVNQFIMVRFLPIMTRVVDKFIEWFRLMEKNGDNLLLRTFRLFANILTEIFNWVERIWDTGSNVLGWLLKFKETTALLAIGVGLLVSYKLGTWIIGITSAIRSLSEAMMGLKVATAGPVVIFGALVLALALLIDDIVNFYEGNDSVIGQMSEKFPAAIWIAHAAVVALTGALVALKWKAIVSLVDTIRLVIMYAKDWAAVMWRVAVANAAATFEIIAIIAIIGAAIGIMYMLWRYGGEYLADIKRWWHNLTDGVSRFIDKIKDSIGWVRKLWDTWDAMPKWARVLIESFVMPAAIPFTLADGGTGSSSAINPKFRPVPFGPIGGFGSSNTNSKVVHINRPQINVYSNDPDKAGKVVHQELDKMHRDATRDAQGGVGI